MWAEQRQETILFQWKAVTPFLCAFLTVTGHKARKAFERPDKHTANLGTARSIGIKPKSCSRGICDVLSVSSPAVRVAPGLWAGWRHSPVSSSVLSRTTWQQHSSWALVSNWRKWGLRWEQEVMTPPGSRGCSPAAFPGLQGSREEAVAPYSTGDGGSCQHWDVWERKERPGAL